MVSVCIFSDYNTERDYYMQENQEKYALRGRPRKKDLFKLPNILCYIRILMVPVFIFLFYRGLYWQSALIAVLASVTDILDGYIARHFNMKTDWGMFIDPVADKLMQFSMLVCAIFKVPAILILVIIFVVKELITLVFGLYIYYKGRNLDGSKWCGKICTVILDLSLFFIIASPKKWLTDQIIYSLITVCTVFLVIAFVVYMHEYVLLFRATREN